MRILSLVFWALAATGCSTVSRTPPVQMFSDMREQPKYMPQSASPFFSDGRAARTPVPGTVARGWLKEDVKHVANPLPIDRALLVRGQERFNIYCAPCHDRTGSGRGIVAIRATWLAQNLTDERMRGMPDGEIFDTISDGRRTMPGYRNQISERDRWAIVAYVRALQRAATGTIADVPAELRSELR